MPWHLGCDSEHIPALRPARIAQEALGLDFDPTDLEFEGPATATFKIEGGACCESGAYDSSVANGCSGVVLSALHAGALDHTIFSDLGNLLFLAHHRAVHGRQTLPA